MQIGYDLSNCTKTNFITIKKKNYVFLQQLKVSHSIGMPWHLTGCTKGLICNRPAQNTKKYWGSSRPLVQTTMS